MQEKLDVIEEEVSRAIIDSQPTNIFAFPMAAGECGKRHTTYVLYSFTGMPSIVYGTTFIRPAEDGSVGEGDVIPLESDGVKPLSKGGLCRSVAWVVDRMTREEVYRKAYEAIAELKAA